MFVFIFSSNEAKANEQENSIIEGNERENEVVQEIEKVYGSIEEFNKVGSFYVDDKKEIHVNFKAGNEEEKQKLSGIKDLNIHEVIYSTDDLQEIQKEIVEAIYLVNKTGRYFSVSYSEEKQSITIEHNNQIPNEIIEKLKGRFPNILIEEKVTQNIPEFLKTKKSNWSKLGAGLGIKSSLTNAQCSTAGIVYKGSRYFILTAGHCFKGATVSTGAGASYVNQYSQTVGRMHTQAAYNRLDAGLVRLEGSSMQRLATNGIKVAYGANNTSEVFDNKFIGWKSMSKGMSVCKTGIATNKTCGTVFSVNQVMEIEGVLYNMSLVLSDDGRRFGDYGDSGGAVYQVGNTGNYLVGILSGRIGADNQYGLVVDVLAVRRNYDLNLYTANTNTSIK